ncbi:MAG: ferritin family protein [Thermoplasmata archaeon]|nr:ferritin family protein [Thermoplasmata archaeon]
MDLSKYTLEELFVTAIKAEIDSREAYSILAGITKNAFLKDRLRFLADEEDKHQTFLEVKFKKHLPNIELTLPEYSPVPLPGIDVSDETVPISQILQQAMDAELAAYDFYVEFAKFVHDKHDLVLTLGYFAKMEQGHYELLKIEKASAEEFEEFDEYHPLMHAGP